MAHLIIEKKSPYNIEACAIGILPATVDGTGSNIVG
jgi:hypothetical protein